MNKKDIITRCIKDSNINWKQQMMLLNKLLKNYKEHEILYAVDYWKSNGIDFVSFGFLTYNCFSNMKYPISLLKAEMNIEIGGDSGERNRKRLEQCNKADNRKESYFDLFEKSR